MQAPTTGLLLLVSTITACGRGAPISMPDPVPDPAQSEQKPPSAPSLCASLGLDPRRVVLANVTGGFGCAQDVTFVHADGSVTYAGTFGAERPRPAECIYLSDVKVAADGEFLLADRLTDGAALFDRNGTLLMREGDPLTLHAELLRRQLWGLLGVVDGYQVLGRPSRGRVPVERFDDQGHRFRGWMNPVDRTVAPIAPPLPIGAAELTWTGDAFAGVVVADGQAQWVQIFPDENRSTPLPDYRGEPYVNLMDRKSGWARVGSYAADRSWRIRESSGTIERLLQELPVGMTQFKEGASPTGSRLYFDLDDDGGFLDTFRDELGAGLFHSPDGVHGWTRIGRAVTQASALYGRGRAGTYVVQSSAFGNATAGWSMPPPGAALLIGSTTQILRPSSGVSLTVEGSVGVLLSREGLCAAFTADAAEPREVSVLDMQTGVTRTVTGFAASRMTWLE